MRLTVLSLLALGSVHSLTIGYPYRSALLAYSPARGEFPIQSSQLKGYLRYFDSNGVEHLVSYSHPEPSNGGSQVTGASSSAVRAYNINPAAYQKSLESHFRAWINVQHKALKSEIETLKAQGKEPSADILAKLQPLEKIDQTADFSTIAELPEVKRLFDEHSRIYRVKTEVLPQPMGEIKAHSNISSIPLVPIEETPEQKQAREEHLRIYNEQVAHLRQLEAVSTTSQSQIYNEAINRLANQADSITEVERARQEHLRLWNEAKLRAEKASYQQENIVKEGDRKAYVGAADKQEIPESVQHPQQGNQEPEEIQKARAEHLRLVNEATLRVQNVQSAEVMPHMKVVTPIVQPQISKLRSSFPNVQQYQPQHEVVDTPEIMRSREEYFRLMNEAKLRAQSVEQEESKHKDVGHLPILKVDIAHAQSIQSHIPLVSQADLPTQIVDTPEVAKAREEHLRLVNEAQQKVQSVKQQLGHVELQTSHPEQIHIAETPEVMQARREHLRIFNEVRSHAEQEEAKFSEIKASGTELKSNYNEEESEKIREEERLKEEARLLERERIREAERLQEEQKQLELDRIREAERLAEEQRQMEAELIRLRLAEEQRLELEKLIESRRLKAEQDQEQHIIITEEFKPMDGQAHQGQQQLFVTSPFLRSFTDEGQPIQQQVQQMYVTNPFLKSPSAESQIPIQQTPLSQAQLQQQPIISMNYPPSAMALEGRKIQSSQESIGTKQQHIKHDYIKHTTADHAGYQPADTAAALIHLEKARQEHFRAHEQALEQLRLARLQNPSLKDCN